MKTISTLKQNLLKTVLFILISGSSLYLNARSLTFGTVAEKPSTFTAILKNNNKVELKWSTEKETDLSHFVIERSTDGINFSDAALVFAFGSTTSRSEYSFPDNISNVKSAVIYYRVSSVGTDNKSQSSEILIIHTNNAE